jgi:putative SOS response-associated peptidase YedK
MHQTVLRKWVADFQLCNLYNIKATGAEIASYFQAQDNYQNQIAVEKDYVAPGKPGYVVRDENCRRVLSAMRWGIPV